MLPRKIYEALPLAYAAAGVACLLGLEGLPRVIPAGSLICAGLLVFCWRQSTRSGERRARRLQHLHRLLRQRRQPNDAQVVEFLPARRPAGHRL